MHFYTFFSSLVYLILTAGLKQNVFVFLKKPLGLTLILRFRQWPRVNSAVLFQNCCVFIVISTDEVCASALSVWMCVGMMRLAHLLMFIFALSPLKIIIFGYSLFCLFSSKVSQLKFNHRWCTNLASCSVWLPKVFH